MVQNSFIWHNLDHYFLINGKSILTLVRWVPKWKLDDDTCTCYTKAFTLNLFEEMHKGFYTQSREVVWQAVQPKCLYYLDTDQVCSVWSWVWVVADMNFGWTASQTTLGNLWFTRDSCTPSRFYLQFQSSKHSLSFIYPKVGVYPCMVMISSSDKID